jgi:DNA-binding PadR family transcriptional regulator
MAPVFAHGQLRLYLLSLLESGPKHGYELITDLADRFGGTYRPSPGTVYPRLARLEEEGLVRRVDDGRKGTYALTDAGLAELAARSGELAALEAGLAETVRGLAAQVRADVRGSMAGLRADLAAAAQQARASAIPAASARPGDARTPRPPPPPPPPPRPGDARTASHVRWAESEAMLQRFRDDLRAELRRVDAVDGVEQLTVDTLRTVLESARTAVRATLR